MLHRLRASVGMRLFGLLAFLVACMLVVGAAALAGLNALRGGTATLAANAANAHRFSEIRQLMAENRSQIMLALQHNPASPSSRLHDHGIESHLAQIPRNRDAITRSWRGYLEGKLSAEEQSLAARYAEARHRYVEEGLAPAVKSLEAGDFDGANAILLRKINPLFKEASAAAVELESLYRVNEHAENALTHAEAELRHTRNLILAATSLAVVMAAVLGWIVAQSIRRPLAAVLGATERSVARDDFTLAVPADGACEIGNVARAFNGLQAKIRQIVGGARGSFAHLAESATSLAASAQKVTSGSRNQSQAISSVAATIEEMSVSLSHVAAHAHESDAIIERSRRESEAALVMTRETMADVEKIASTIRGSTDEVRQLAANSEQIGGIVGVIREIADQTNLLALNAAIEAARAGEQGRGFAVVADEVRKLAERTAGSTAEIAQLIQVIQGQVGRTVEAMRAADQRIAAATDIAASAGHALRKVADEEAEIERRVREIANAVREQDTAMRDIARHIEHIAQMTDENSTAARHNSEVARGLDELAASTLREMSRYTV